MKQPKARIRESKIREIEIKSKVKLPERSESSIKILIIVPKW
jgi:hypothetical protein